MRRLSKGFTVLCDLSQLQLLSREWSEIVIETQKMLVEAGCSWTAEILPKAAIAKIQADRISSCSGMQKKEFACKDTAETWLDSISLDQMDLFNKQRDKQDTEFERY